jgi:hypothetical protein
MFRHLAMVASPAVLIGCLFVSVDRPLVGDQTPAAPTRAEIDTFIKQAIEDRFAAKNIPDFNLLDKGTRIAVREEMPAARMKLGRDALPERAGYEFYLIALAATQQQADTMQRPVPFIAVDGPSITGDTAAISMGVDVTFPTDPKIAKLCCCTGRGEFKRVNGRWTFVKWADMICS